MNATPDQPLPAEHTVGASPVNIGERDCGSLAATKGDEAVELIVFDMGHVFIDFHFETVCLGFCNHAGIRLEQLKPVLGRLSKLGYEIGVVTTAEFLFQLNAELKALSPHPQEQWRDIELSEFHEMWNFNFSENVEMAALLAELKTKHRLALLSNTNESHFQSLESKFKVTRHFDLVFLSYLLGVQKPDSAIYEHVIKEAGVRPERMVFVDDRSENIEAARALKIVAIQFASAGQVRGELQKLGLLN